MKKFEYKGTLVPCIKIVNDLNELGAEGWEVITVIPHGKDWVSVLLKREEANND